LRRNPPPAIDHVGFLDGDAAHQGWMAERKAMIDREYDLPITKQAEVL
jgi:hypothetical protein